MKSFTIMITSLAMAIVTSGIVIFPIGFVFSILVGGVASTFSPYYGLASGLGSMVVLLTLGWIMLVILLWIGYGLILDELLEQKSQPTRATKTHTNLQGKWGQTATEHSAGNSETIVVP